MNGQSLQQRGNAIGHWLLAWSLAVLVTYGLASIAHTARVLNDLRSLGITIGLGDQLQTTLGDMAGLYAYAVVIAVGLLIAFLVMGVVVRRTPLTLMIAYPLGGMLAMATLLLAMKLALSITPIAGARSLAGFALQVLAGCAGGLMFAYRRRLARLP